MTQITLKEDVTRSKFVYYFFWLLIRIFRFFINAKYKGSDNIPSSGPFVLASNHQHIIDPLLLSNSTFREVFFFAKEELWDNKILGWIISKGNGFPVKRGAADIKAFRKTKSILSSNFGLVFFPEGTRSQDDNFLKPKPGIGVLLKITNIPVPIVPVYINASNRLMDCFLRKNQLAVIIGKPISSEEVSNYLTDKDGYQALAERIMGEITLLKNQVNYQKQVL